MKIMTRFRAAGYVLTQSLVLPIKDSREKNNVIVLGKRRDFIMTYGDHWSHQIIPAILLGAALIFANHITPDIVFQPLPKLVPSPTLVKVAYGGGAITSATIRLYFSDLRSLAARFFEHRTPVSSSTTNQKSKTFTSSSKPKSKNLSLSPTNFLVGTGLLGVVGGSPFQILPQKLLHVSPWLASGTDLAVGMATGFLVHQAAWRLTRRAIIAQRMTRHAWNFGHTGPL